jgi:allophanate hydrolase subunit 1
MTHTILIEFDPKNASPLEVINTLNKLMQTNLEEQKISDYSISIPTPNGDIDVIELEAKEGNKT